MEILHIKNFLKRFKLDKYLYLFKQSKPLIINVVCFILGVFSLFLLSSFLREGQTIIQSTDMKIDNGNDKGELKNDVEEQRENCNLHIDINGAVNYPGVYCLSSGARIIDVINKAKGFNKLYAQRYVEQKLNLSLPIEDNQKIYIPYLSDLSCQTKSFTYETIIVTKGGEENGQSSHENSTGSKSSCVSINEGSLDQLKTLKGIGDSIAQKIVDSRPYKSINDLKNVSGIGDKVFDNIKSSICL